MVVIVGITSLVVHYQAYKAAKQILPIFYDMNNEKGFWLFYLMMIIFILMNN